MIIMGYWAKTMLYIRSKTMGYMRINLWDIMSKTVGYVMYILDKVLD